MGLISRKLFASMGVALVAYYCVGCSSFPEVRTLAYAKLKTEEVFEYDFPVVWNAIEASIRSYSVLERTPAEISPVELKQLNQRTLKTDWIYSQSRNKYQEYVINGIPKKTYLQSRHRFTILAHKTLGGVRVSIRLDEEVQKLKYDGTTSDYSPAGEVDTSRSSELLNKIKFSLLSISNQ